MPWDSDYYDGYTVTNGLSSFLRIGIDYVSMATLYSYSDKVNSIWTAIMLQDQVHSTIRQRNLQGCLIGFPTSTNTLPLHI